MRSTWLLSIFLAFALMGASGCELAGDASSASWFDFWGYCQLELTIHVKSEPGEAEVFVGDDFKGTTPCTIVLGAKQAITGQKCLLSSPQDGKARYLVRNTSLQGHTPYTIRAVRKGSDPLSKKLTLEEFFPSATFESGKLYAKAVTMVFAFE